MSEPDYKQECIRQEREIQLLLGEALYGYQDGLPCWGDHVAVTLAIEAARRIRQLTAALKEIVDPIAKARETAKQEGSQLDGQMCVHLSNSANYLKEVARKALAEYPPPSDIEKDARRYRAIANHIQILDPRMDGTALYRVRGISGRYRNFDEAADELVRRELAGESKRRDPWSQDKDEAPKP